MSHHQNLLEQVAQWLSEDGSDVDLVEHPPGLRIEAALEHACLPVALTFLADRRLHLEAHLPVRPPRRLRPAVGDYLHRLNLDLRLLHWRFDPDYGAISCRHTVDLPRDSRAARHTLHHELGRLLLGVDGMLPATLGVCGGGLRPAFAVDQALAGLLDLTRSSSSSDHSPP